MHAYAARFDPADHHPRVALLLAGIGLDPGASGDAIRDLPAAISLAISPYAPDPTALLAAARAAGHEYLLSLPMEPARYPLNDPGPRALLTSHTPAQNQAALIWALSRFPGYVGVTGALGAMDGERFAGASEDIDPVLRRLAARGLLYVDPRPGAARLPFAWGRAADVTIDRADDPAAIDRRARPAGPDRGAQGQRARRGRRAAAHHPDPARRLGTGVARAGPGADPGQRARCPAARLAACFAARIAPPRITPCGAVWVARWAAARRPDRRKPAEMTAALPYRPNVGAVLFDAAGRVFLARRADLPNAEGAAGGWQLPQGGIDRGRGPARRHPARARRGDRHGPRRDSRRASRLAAPTTCRPN